jgi:hypothetical protein
VDHEILDRYVLIHAGTRALILFLESLDEGLQPRLAFDFMTVRQTELDADVHVVVIQLQRLLDLLL